MYGSVIAHGMKCVCYVYHYNIYAVWSFGSRKSL